MYSHFIQYLVLSLIHPGEKCRYHFFLLQLIPGDPNTVPSQKQETDEDLFFLFQVFSQWDKFGKPPNGNILSQCPKHLNWLLLMRTSSCSMPNLLHDKEEVPFRNIILKKTHSHKSPFADLFLFILYRMIWWVHWPCVFADHSHGMNRRVIICSWAAFTWVIYCIFNQYWAFHCFMVPFLSTSRSFDQCINEIRWTLDDHLTCLVCTHGLCCYCRLCFVTTPLFFLFFLS